MEKFIVKVNGKQFTIEIEETNNLNSIKHVLLDGKKINIDVNMNNLGSIVVDNNTHKINGIYDYDGEPVKFLIGKDYHNVEIEEYLPIQKLAGNKVVSKNVGIITAPMPGKVVSIDVNIGDNIAIGQNLLVLEAMKMENLITSPAKGVLKSISTKVGASCNSREVLMTIE